MTKYELRWGDEYGNATTIDLPGVLAIGHTIALARATQDWWNSQPNYTNVERFVTLKRVEDVKQYTEVYFE